MRIAMVVPGGVDRSGEVRVIPALLALIRQLTAARLDVEVFALDQEPEPGCWKLAGARVHNIGRKGTRRRTVSRLWAEHRRRRFDLVHSIWSGTPGLVALAASRLMRVPCLVHVAGGELVALRDIHYGGALTWRGRLRERVVLRAASAVTAASGPMVDALRALDVSAERVPLGVDLRSWPERAPVRRVPGQALRLISVASLNRVKDHRTLLECITMLRADGLPVEVDIVGEDTLAGEVHQRTRALGLADRVHFHGFLPQSQLRPLVEAADLMLLTSRHEAGPLAVLEAAVAGVPTVGTNVGHVAEWAPDAAVAVAVGDARALAAAVMSLARDDDRRLSLAREAQHRAVIENAALTASKFQALYRRLLDSQRVG